MRSLLQSPVVLFQFVSNYKLSRSQHSLRGKKKKKGKKPTNKTIKGKAHRERNLSIVLLKMSSTNSGLRGQPAGTDSVSFYTERNTNISPH